MASMGHGRCGSPATVPRVREPTWLCYETKRPIRPKEGRMGRVAIPGGPRAIIRGCRSSHLTSTNRSSHYWVRFANCGTRHRRRRARRSPTGHRHSVRRPAGRSSRPASTSRSSPLQASLASCATRQRRRRARRSLTVRQRSYTCLTGQSTRLTSTNRSSHCWVQFANCGTRHRRRRARRSLIFRQHSYRRRLTGEELLAGGSHAAALSRLGSAQA